LPRTTSSRRRIVSSTVYGLSFEITPSADGTARCVPMTAPPTTPCHRSLLNLPRRTDACGRADSDDEVPPRHWSAGLNDLADGPDGVDDCRPCRVGHETGERFQRGRPL